MLPQPDVRLCVDCGWSEFSVPESWLSAGWLRAARPSAAGNGPVLVADQRALAG